MYGGSTTIYRSRRHHKETDDIELNERSLFKLFVPSLYNTPSLKINRHIYCDCTRIAMDTSTKQEYIKCIYMRSD